LPIIVGPTEELAPRMEDEFEALVRQVFGDAFHSMDRIKVLVHHEWKAAYFAALPEAIFIYDCGDKK
jgi:hypothetical protein